MVSVGRNGMRFNLTRSLAAAALCLIAVLAIGSAALAENPIDAAAEQRLLQLINQERAAAGVAQLTLDPRLTQAARKHTRRMIDQDSVAHQLPGEDKLLLRLVAENIHFDRDGENIAQHGDIDLAHDALMESPGHRGNILSPEFNAVGIGVLHSGDLVYVTEDFARVLLDYSQFEADAAAQQAIVDYARARGMPTPARKPRTQLVQMACGMARGDKIDPKSARNIPGTTSAVAWNATDPRQLPPGLRSILEKPVLSGYSLGVCFAPSTTYPAGVYWLIFVTY